MATIIALTNQKGGVGKTTTSSALAAGLVSFYDKKVLAIDLDPQGSLGFSLGLDIEDCNNIYDVLTGQVPVGEAIQPTDYCDVITSNILLSSAEIEFTSSEDADKTCEEIKAMGVDSIVIKGDVRNKDDVDSLIAKTLEQFGKIDIFVNNAGFISIFRRGNIINYNICSVRSQLHCYCFSYPSARTCYNSSPSF